MSLRVLDNDVRELRRGLKRQLDEIRAQSTAHPKRRQILAALAEVEALARPK